MKTARYFLVLPAVVILIAVLATGQSVPQLINYQGRLTDDAGAPINTTVPMHFALLDGDTMTATVLWGETQTSVQVSQGIYNVMLGSVDPIPGSALDGATVFLEVQVAGETLKPRQRLTSVAYAIRSSEAVNAQNLGGQPSGDYYSKAQVDALIANLQSQIAANTAGLAAEISDRQIADSLLTTNLTNEVNRALTEETFLQTSLDTEIVDREDADAALSNRITPLETKLASVSVADSDFIFTGVDVNIRSGSGSTGGTINGKGNLIIGYNENSGDTRTGSHNLIIGPLHSYSSYGGLVSGYDNTISNSDASVSGGANNTASGQYSSVSGGRYNVASGDWSFVAGGGGATAGAGNEAYSHYSAILGGQSNDTGDGATRTVGQNATVSGGSINRASGSVSSVSGGSNNIASNSGSSVSGGNSNTASGPWSSVSGGYYHTASGTGASVSGGYGRSLTGQYDWAACDTEYSCDQ